MLKPSARIALIASGLALVLASSAPAAIQVGSGGFPGMDIDTAGTGYLGWMDGPTGSQTLNFCRLPRAVSACEANKAIGPVNGDVVTNVKVAVSGSRVVLAHTDRIDNSNIGQFAWTSSDGGNTFGPRRVIGSIQLIDHAVGPGDALSGVTAGTAGVRYQAMPLDGTAPANPDGTSAVPVAQLSAETKVYDPTVGLIDAATPIVVWEREAGAAFSRYKGSGDVNSAANWTAPADIGAIFNPQLAGGPTGLFLLGSERSNPFDPGNTIVRKYDGTTFGPAVTVGGVAVSSDLTQDAGGRLHAIFTNGRDANTIDVNHAVSDNGVNWRSGILETFPASTTGAIVRPTVRVAPDHIGLLAAATATDPGGVGAIRLGPDAPGATPPPPPVPPAPPAPPAQKGPLPVKFSASSTLVQRGSRFEWKVSGWVDSKVPADRQYGCGGTVKATLLRGKKVVAKATMKVAQKRAFCSFKLKRKVRKSAIGEARKLTLRLRFSGSPGLAPGTFKKTIRPR